MDAPPRRRRLSFVFPSLSFVSLGFCLFVFLFVLFVGCFVIVDVVCFALCSCLFCLHVVFVLLLYFVVLLLFCFVVCFAHVLVSFVVRVVLSCCVAL